MIISKSLDLVTLIENLYAVGDAQGQVQMQDARCSCTLYFLASDVDVHHADQRLGRLINLYIEAHANRSQGFRQSVEGFWKGLPDVRRKE